MPYRQNPFYQFSYPYLGNAVNGLASVMFPSQTGGGMDAVRQSAALENEAQARQAEAVAALNAERERGYRNTNNAMMSDPSSIAELLLSGGALKDDPIRINPNFQPPAPVDFSSLMSATVPPPDANSSAVMPNRTAQDKMAAAIQEAVIRKIPLDQILKSSGIAEYLRRIQGQNPDSALGLAPFAGIHAPNAETSLTTSRQDQVSARNSAEDIAKQETVNKASIEREKLQQIGAKEREGMQQAGAFQRTKYNKDNDPVSAGANVDVFITKAQADKLGIKANADGQYVISGRTKVGTGQDITPGTAGGDAVAGRQKTSAAGAGGSKGPSAVPNVAAKRMENKIKDALAADGINADGNAMAGLVSAAGSEWQASKNPDAAADAIIQRLRNGEDVNGVKINKGNRTIAGMPIPGTERKSADRAPPGSASTPITPAATTASSKPPVIGSVQGAPAGSTIGSFVPNKGWEVKSASGKVIGYAQ